MHRRLLPSRSSPLPSQVFSSAPRPPLWRAGPPHARVRPHTGPPEPPNVTRNAAGIVDLRWGAADSGGAPILGYRIVAVLQHETLTLTLALTLTLSRTLTLNPNPNQVVQTVVWAGEPAVWRELVRNTSSPRAGLDVLALLPSARYSLAVQAINSVGARLFPFPLPSTHPPTHRPTHRPTHPLPPPPTPLMLLLFSPSTSSTSSPRPWPRERVRRLRHRRRSSSRLRAHGGRLGACDHPPRGGAPARP